MARTNNHCPHCGNKNGAKGDFCPNCGKNYSDPVVTLESGTAPADAEEKRGFTNTLIKVLVILLLMGLVIVTCLLLSRCNDTKTTATATIVYAEGKSEPIDANTVHLFVLNPTAQPQTQIGHPSIYTETHISGNPIKYVFDVPEGYIGIVGGYKVDNLDKGVYKAFGPGQYEIVVIDGFGLITNDNWAQEEFQFRVDQAIQFNWAYAHIIPGPLTDPTK